MRAALSLVLLLGACSARPDVDPCAGYPQTCIVLEIDAPAGTSPKVDQISLLAPMLGLPTERFTPEQPRPNPAHLPVLLAVVPGTTFQGGGFSLSVTAWLAGTAIGTAEASGSVANGKHAIVPITLTLESAGDLGVPGDASDQGPGDQGISCPAPDCIDGLKCAAAGTNCTNGAMCAGGMCGCGLGPDWPCCTTGTQCVLPTTCLPCGLGATCETSTSDCCGGANQRCCSKGGPLCGGGLTCSGGMCVSGGGPICGPGAVCAAGTVCNSGNTCVACGASGQPCCTNGLCAGGGCCVNNSCVNPGSACASGGTCVGAIGCNGPCGASGSSCCPGMPRCNSTSLACNAAPNTCLDCGAVGQNCCTGGTCSQAGACCDASTGLCVGQGKQCVQNSMICSSGTCGGASQAPTVSGFSPASGAAGSSVMISGTNFLAANTVTFNATSAAVTFTSGTSITATVPPAATNGPVCVSNTNGNACAPGFKVTVVITPATLPNGTISTPYSQVLNAQGGVQPYLWSLSGGTLPMGLSFNTSTHTISGTPTQSGAPIATIQVQDTGGVNQQIVSKDYMITIQ